MLFQIGLTKKRMAGWDREKQFNEVMRRISEMKDEKQRRASLTSSWGRG